MNLLNEKNNYIKDVERENGDLNDKINDLQRQITRLEEDDKVSILFRLIQLHEQGLRQHVESLKKLVEVKNQSIEKLEGEILILKEEMNSNSLNFNFLVQENEYLHEVKKEKQGKGNSIKCYSQTPQQ